VDPAEALPAERAAAARLAADLKAELAGIIAGQGENPPDDEHDVEGSSVGYERARVTALLADAEARVAEADAALARISARSYGGCEACGGPIGDDRLEALPTTRQCVSCASSSGRPAGPLARRRG